MSSKMPKNSWEWLGFKSPDTFIKSRELGAALGVLITIIAFALIIAAVAVMFHFLRTILIIDISSTQDYASVRNIGLALAAFIGAPFVVWRALVAQKQVDVAEQGLITDRINKSVQGLSAERAVKRVVQKKKYAKDDVGNWQRDDKGGPIPILDPFGETEFEEVSLEMTLPNLEVRIGSIYALERIARDSLRDHIQVMEILCAYVRENAPANTAVESPLEIIGYRKLQHASTFDLAVLLPSGPEKSLTNWADRLPEPRLDVQAALTVIGRRSSEQIALERAPNSKNMQYRLDFTGTNLQGANFSDGDFSYAMFTNSRLDGAIFNTAILESVLMIQTSLQGAYFKCAVVKNVIFLQCNLNCADFEDAVLYEVGVVSSPEFIGPKAIMIDDNNGKVTAVSKPA